MLENFSHTWLLETQLLKSRFQIDINYLQQMYYNREHDLVLGNPLEFFLLKIFHESLYVKNESHVTLHAKAGSELRKAPKS